MFYLIIHYGLFRQIKIPALIFALKLFPTAIYYLHISLLI